METTDFFRGSWGPRGGPPRAQTQLVTRTLLTFLLVMSGCNVNVFEPFEDTDTPEAHVEAGRMALDRGDYERAIIELEHANLQAPHQVPVLSDLASAYAGRAGMSFVGIAFAMQGVAAASDGTDQSFLSAIASEKRMPKADGAALTDLARALAILSDDVPADQVNDEIRVQRAIVQLGHAAVTPLAIADLNRDRILQPEELLFLSDDSLNAMVGDIRTANKDVKKVAQTRDLGGFTQRIDDALATIAAQPGRTDAEKARMFVARQFAQ